jgi:hypothetical protein
MVLTHTDFTDMAYSGALATVLSGVEPAVAITMACIPLIGPLCRRRRRESAVEQGNTPRTRSSKNYTKGLGSQKSMGASVLVGSFEQLDDAGSEIRLQPLDSK